MNNKIVVTSFMENLSFDERTEVCGRSYNNKILFWDYEDMHLFVPVLVLSSPLEITTFEFKPNDPNILIAGAVNGQILLWNLTGKLQKKESTQGKKGGRKAKEDKAEAQEITPVIISALQEPFITPQFTLNEVFSRKMICSHRTQVTSLKFLPPRVELDRKNPFNLLNKPEHAADYHMFMTSSADGQLLFWDTKFEAKDKKAAASAQNLPDYNVAWKGLLSVQLQRPEGGQVGCSSFSFNNKHQQSTKFYGTSDEGDMYIANWCAKPTDEQNKIEVIQKIWSGERSARPAIALDISPFFDDIILSIFDCHFTLWKVDCDEPIFVSHTIKETWITCGFFSPTRPGVIYIGMADGNLEIWDFIDQSNAPTFVHLVVAVGINSMKINPTKPNLLAVGDRDGYLHLLDLGKNLTRKVNGEEQIIADFFEREKDRVNYYKERFDIRVDEHRIRMEKQDQGDDNGGDFGKMKRADDDKAKSDEEMLEEAYQEFLKEFLEGKKEDKEGDTPKKDTKKKR